MLDSPPLSIHCECAAFRWFTLNRHLQLVRVRDPNCPYLFSKSDLYKSFQIDSEAQMYLCSSALIFYIDWTSGQQLAIFGPEIELKCITNPQIPMDI